MAKEDECCYCTRMWIITILEGKELKDTVNEGHNDSECEKVRTRLQESLLQQNTRDYFFPSTRLQSHFKSKQLGTFIPVYLG